MPEGPLLGHVTDIRGFGACLNISNKKGLLHSGWPHLFSLGRTRAAPGSLCTGVSHPPRLLCRGAGQTERKEKQGKRCAFLQGRRSLPGSPSGNTSVKGHSLCPGCTVSLGEDVSFDEAFLHESN